MKHFGIPLLLCACAVSMAAQSANDVKARIDRATESAKKLAADPAVIKAVREQNAKAQTLATIKEIDEKWAKNDPSVANFAKQMTQNTCAQKLKAFAAADPSVAEVFATDNQGANVCMTSRTSDYWQGDEPKWQKSYAGGKGSVFVDTPRTDQSTNEMLVQISVPVLDGGKAIGALTSGFKVDKLK